MAFLAGLPPIYGIYTTFCVAFVYMFFGTSKFTFMGTNIIICFMVKNCISRVLDHTHDQIYLYPHGFGAEVLSRRLNSTVAAKHTFLMMAENNEELIRLASSLTFFVAVIQGLMYILRLDFVFCYLSEHVIKGYSLGVAIRVILNQLQHLLHIRFRSCISDVSLTCLPSAWDCLDSVDWHIFALSICSLLLLIVGRQILGPVVKLRRRLRTPFSIDFMLVVFISFLSYLLDAEQYNLETVKFVNDRIQFTPPHLGLFGDLVLDALAIALFSYALHLRMVKESGKKHKYAVDDRQELFASSMIGVISSLLSSQPAGQSCIRNRVGIGAGARSVVANVPLVLTLLPLLIWAPVFFQSLPVSILSCIVLAGLGIHFTGICHLVFLWHISRLDVATFLFSCLAALMSPNLSFALFASIVFSASTIVMRSQWPKVQLLVNVTGSGAYYAEKCFYGSELLDESGVGVLRYESSILFNNVNHFRSKVLEVANGIKGQLLGVGIGTRAGSMKSMKSTNAAVVAGFAPAFGQPGAKDLPTRSTLLISGDFVPNYDSAEQSALTKVLILDFCSVPIVDSAGLEAIKDVFSELAEKKIRLLLASVNCTIRTKFKMCGGFDTMPKHFFFPSVHDAVLCAQQLGGVIAPSIHMSVSLNGCRDLITLSTATSNHNFDTGDGHAPYSGMHHVPSSATLGAGSNTPRPSIHSIGTQGGDLTSHRGSPTPPVSMHSQVQSAHPSLKLSLKKSNS
ncbi:sulfate permease family domain-containing protein [Ditylenchus destructor]|nr:sulfate permease family domain-containing protein [Ditylenchus destructor]